MTAGQKPLFPGADQDTTDVPVCMFPRCIEGEKPDWCGVCADLLAPYEAEWGANAGKG